MERTCSNCGLAAWQRTVNGRLHPNKDGECTWKPPVLVVPRAVQFSYGARGDQPQTVGGQFISRDARRVHRDCIAWVPVPLPKPASTSGAA